MHGQVRRGSVGVRIEPLPPGEPARLGIPGGVSITAVAPGTPASGAGLQPGDIILTAGQTPVRLPGHLQSAVESVPAGGTLTLTVLRDGQHLSIEVRPTPNESAVAPVATPAEPSPPAAAAPPSADAVRNPTRFPGLGLRLSEPTAELARQHGIDPVPQGLFVRGIEPGGPADQAGLEIGMVITDAGGRAVRSLGDFRAALRAGRPTAT